MARTAITPETVVVTGLEPTSTAGIADGHKFRNTGRTMLRVVNSGASSRDVTVVTPKTDDGLAIADLVVAIPAGEVRYIGPFRRDLYNQPSGADAGMVHVDWDDGNESELSVEVIEPGD